MRVPRPADQNLLRMALSGMAGLALAIGLGRFAYTSVLPMMQADMGLSLTDGGWLAIVNQLGYLFGGLTAASLRQRPVHAARVSLLLLVTTLLAMGLTSNLGVWLALRFVNGVASAWMMVMISILCLPQLVAAPRLAGWVYAGVGSGTALGGFICLLLVIVSAPSSVVWVVLALFAALLGWPVWQTFVLAATSRAATAAPQRQPSREGGLDRWRLRILVACYALYGFGYILPATFLPAQARILLDDHWAYSFAWPVFGLAAAASTLLAARIAARIGALPTWIGAHLVMAGGVLVPVVWPELGGVLLAALCVGGTFVVITLLAMQLAQQHGGAQAGLWMARLTTAFAAGQVLGPAVVVWLDGQLEPGMWLAALVLLASALLLGWQHRRDVTHALP